MLVALHAAAGAQRDVGVVCGFGDADQRVGGRYSALRGCDVRPALKQLGRYAGGHGGRSAGEGLLGDVEPGCGLADEDGDCVFVLRALLAQVDQLRARLFELRLRLLHIDLGDQAAFAEGLR